MTPSLTEAVARARCARSLDMEMDDPRFAEMWPRYSGEAALALQDTLAAIEAAGFEIVEKRPESAPITLEVGQRWVPTSPKAKPRTITKIGPHRSWPFAGSEVAFFDVEGETPGEWPRALHFSAFLRWVRKNDARLAARPGAGE